MTWPWVSRKRFEEEESRAFHAEFALKVLQEKFDLARGFVADHGRMPTDDELTQMWRQSTIFGRKPMLQMFIEAGRLEEE